MLLVGVGLVSYSAYLWHQPLFALMRQRKFDPPNAMFLVFLSLLAMLLAYVTWRYVRLPFETESELVVERSFVLELLASFYLRRSAFSDTPLTDSIVASNY